MQWFRAAGFRANALGISGPFAFCEYDMAVTRQYIGRRITSTPDAGLGVVSAGTMRVSVFTGPPQHYWLEKIGARIGKATSTTAQGQLVTFDAEGGLDERIARTASQSLNALFNLSTGSGGGANVVAGLVDPVSGTPIKGALLRSGRDLGVGFLALVADVGHGMAFIGGPGVSGDVNLYDKYGLSSVPADWGDVVGDPEGKGSFWLECWTNEAPRVPIERSPSGSISTLTPAFKSTGRDRNGLWGPANSGFDSGDYIARVRIELRIVGQTSPFWTKEYVPTQAEREDGRGDVRTDEGVYGLRRALMYAGARAVVATLEQVPDAESRPLVRELYNGLAAGLPRAESLRRAQVKMIADRRKAGGAAHPFYWAAFTLTGDGD